MKKISILIVFILLVLTFTSCQKSIADENSTQPSESYSYSSGGDNQTQDREETQQNETSAENSISSQQSKPDTQQTQETEENKVVTYISENPNNTYICRVADKYGSDKSNLIAFIKTNSSTPGATVLEFSGKKDANGNLIVTAEELRYIYDVPDSGTIKRASSDGKNNDGYNKITAKAAIMLAEKFFIPSIDEMREKRRYEDYFTN